MRQLWLLLAGASLLGSAIGCRVKTGVCDCIDLPPPIVTPYGGAGPVAGPAPVSTAPLYTSPAMSVPATTPETIKVPPMPQPNKSETLQQIPDSTTSN
jgi:hypothetical protein